LNPDEIETGSYEIGTSAFLEVVEIATFSVVLNGDISPDYSDFIFTHATACIPCVRTCDSETFIGKCESPTRIGQSCQIAGQIVPVSQDPVIQSLTVPAFESLWQGFQKLRNQTILQFMFQDIHQFSFE
jgi:hypothetical protein